MRELTIKKFALLVFKALLSHFGINSEDNCSFFGDRKVILWPIRAWLRIRLYINHRFQLLLKLTIRVNELAFDLFAIRAVITYATVVPNNGRG